MLPSTPRTPRKEPSTPGTPRNESTPRSFISLKTQVDKLHAQISSLVDQIEDDKRVDDLTRRRSLQELDLRLEGKIVSIEERVEILNQDTKSTFQQLGVSVNDVIQSLTDHINTKLQEIIDPTLRVRLLAIEEEIAKSKEEFSENRQLLSLLECQMKNNHRLVSRQVSMTNALVSELQGDMRMLSSQMQSVLKLVERTLQAKAPHI